MKPDIELELPFITAELPGIGGRLRATPAHFVVEEIPLYTACGDGQHLYVNITKEGLTTREVQQQLARVFNVPDRDVGFAGMKDKHARTTQTFSLLVGHVDEAFVAGAAERIAAQLPVEVNWVRRHHNKLKKGHLLGNRFAITVTELAVPLPEAQRRAHAIAHVLRQRGLPNYYGPQRLGREGANVVRGEAILDGEKGPSNRWLRRLLLASVQSYLCNRYLARRVTDGLYDRLLTGDIAKKYDTGGLFMVEDAAVEQPRYEALEIGFTAPIYGPKMWAARAEAGRLEAAVLDEAGITVAQLQKAGLKGTRRMGRIRLTDLAVAADEDGLVVDFSLPKGAFATTVLRELMKVDYATLAQAPDGDA